MKMKWRKTDGGRDEGKEMKIAGKGDGDRERKRKIEREADRPVEEEMKIEG